LSDKRRHLKFQLFDMSCTGIDFYYGLSFACHNNNALNAVVFVKSDGLL